MSNPHVSRLKKNFPTYVYSTIASSLKEHQGIGATILICCAIDTLASYAASNPSTINNKDKFLTFVSKYFPPDYDAEKFYKFVRCGLVHSFSMENEYIILCSEATWAQELHLSKPEGFDRIVINPYTLFRHLKKAHKQFVDDLEKNHNLRKEFSLIYKKRPILKQHIRVPKALKKVSILGSSNKELHPGRTGRRQIRSSVVNEG